MADESLQLWWKALTAKLDKWDWPRCPKKEWGRVGWGWLHRAAIHYSSRPCRRDAEFMALRIWHFVNNLPCAECVAHATEYVKNKSPAVTSRDALVLWTWNFHNAVNARLGKPYFTFEEFSRRYADDFRIAAAGAY